MPDVRVVTLNLFNNAAGRWSDRVELVCEQARALDADVFTFQECDLGDGASQVAAVAAALGPSYELVPLRNPSADSIKSLAVVTRLPVEGEPDGCLDLGGGDIALRVRLAGDLEVVTTHLHFGPSRRGSEIRSAQARRLLAWLGPVGAGRGLVLTGDFNSAVTGESVKAMKQCLRSAHEEVHGDEPPWTHPTPLIDVVDTEAAFGVPILPKHGGRTIDYVFVSPAVSVLDCRICFDVPSPAEPSLFPSDHLGLVADLTW
jgi:endonuclease/exonuclease/phosphatase family metal-dependent hydrolase